MKKGILTLISFYIVVTAFAQTPQLFNYQAIARDDQGIELANQIISLKISILSGSATGAVVYTETHSVSTNEFGLFTIQIGGGGSSDDFSTIDWGIDSKWIRTEVDFSGGTEYTPLGLPTQLLSVPYAIYAASAGNSTGGNSVWTQSGDEISYNQGRVLVGDELGGVNNSSLNDDPLVNINKNGINGASEPVLLQLTGHTSVDGATGDDGMLQIGLTNTPGNASIYFSSVDDISSGFLFKTRNAQGIGDRMVISQDGRVGIGTITPTSPLTVAGTIETTSGGIRFPDGTIQTTAATGGNSSSVWTQNGNNISYNEGEVSISNGLLINATDLGDAKLKIEVNSDAAGRDVLQIMNRSTGNGSLATIRFRASNEESEVGAFAYAGTTYTGVPDYAGRTLVTNNTNGILFNSSGAEGEIIFQVNPDGTFPSEEAMRVTSDLRVGIGTTTPTSPLTVAGTIETTTGGIKFPDGTVQTTAAIGGNGSSIWRENGQGEIHSPEGESVLIGKSTSFFTGQPTNYLELAEGYDIYMRTPNPSYGSIYFRSGQSNGSLNVWSAGVEFWTSALPNGANWSEKMRLTKEGNLGIGTASPTSPLTVAGTIETTTGGVKFPDGTIQTTAAIGSGSNSAWAENGDDITYRNGSVGIGTGLTSKNILAIASGADFDNKPDHREFAIRNFEPDGIRTTEVFIRVDATGDFFNPIVKANDHGLFWLDRLENDFANTQSGFVIAPRSNEPGIRIDHLGRLGVGTGDIPSRLTVNDGDIYIEDAANGVIMKSPNGSCFRMTVSDAGQPVFTAIPCP